MLKSKIFWVVISTLILGTGGYIGYKLLTDNSNLANYIPKNAAVVFSADFKSLATKVNYDKLKSMRFLKSMRDQSSSDPNQEKFKSKYAEDPFASGISFLKDAYFFGGSRDGKPFGGAVVGLSNREKFENFLKDIPDVNLKIVGKGKYSYTEYESDLFLVWNDEACIVMPGLGSNEKEYAQSLISLKKKESINDLDAFKKFRSNSFDLGMFMNFEELQKIAGSSALFTGSTVNFKYVYAQAFLNFEKDEIVLSGEMTGNQEEISKNNMMKERGIGNDMQPFFSNKKPIVFLSMALDMKHIFNSLNQQAMYKEPIRLMQENTGLSQKDIESIFQGEFTFSLFDVNSKTVTVSEYDYETEENYETEKEVMVPSMALSMSVANKAPLIDFMKNMNLSGENGMWSIPLPEENLGSMLYIVETTKGFTLTNDEEASSQLMNSKKFTYVPEGEIKKMMEENPFAMNLNLQVADMPSAIQDKIKLLGDRSDVLKELDRVCVTSNGLKSVFSLKLKEGSDNSLFRIFQMVDKAIYN